MHSLPPGDPEPSLADLVTGAARRLRRVWRDGLAPWDLSPHQGRALLVVALRPGLRLSDLADRLRIAPRSATEVVDGLVERGLATRVPDPSDRRAVLVELTAAGHRTVSDIRRSQGDAADQTFGSLSDADRAHLRRILGGIVAGEPPRE
ncbi:MAG: MarR family winged helix-turn-helix transcriptional regulator [Lapillicoccus sp.]